MSIYCDLCILSVISRRDSVDYQGIYAPAATGAFFLEELMERYCYRCERDVELVTDEDSNAQVCPICGTIIIHSANHLPEGTILGGFQIIGELGRGGMGIVYRARQLNLERDVALKVLSDDLANDLEFVDRFFKEARSAASLNHPNIVQVFDAGRTPEGISYFAMELIEGETLEVHIDNNGNVSPEDSLKIAVKIADALNYAWKSQQLTHGDIKPDNIILTNNVGGAKLADLGLAKCVYDEASDDGIMATPLYAPPEVIRGELQKIGYRSDMYSFGVTLFQMLTGEPPFPDGDPEMVFQMHLTEKPPSLYDFNEKFSPALVSLCAQLMAKEPEERPESWEDVHNHLKQIKDPEVAGKVFHTHHVIHDLPEEEEPPPNPLLSLTIKALIGLTVVLVIAVVAAVALKSKKKKKQPISTGIENPETVSDEWAATKQKLSKLTTERAIISVNKFITEHKDNTPEEVKEVLKKLKLRQQEAKRRKAAIAKKQAEFQKSVEDLLKQIKKTPNPEKISISKVKALTSKIYTLLQKASSFSYLKIPDDEIKYLNQTLTNLKIRISAYRKKQEEIRREKIATEQKKRLQAEISKIDEFEQERMKQMAKNRSVNRYYRALQDFSETKKVDSLVDGLLDWDKDSELVAPQYEIRVNFLNHTVIPNASHILSLLKSKEFCFKEQPLPPEICPGKYQKYTVKSFYDKGIKLIYRGGKITLGHNIPWSALKPEHIVLMIKARLLEPEHKLTELNHNEKSTILAFTLLFSNKQFSDIFNSIGDLSTNELECWSMLDRDFNNQTAENKCIDLYEQLNSELEEKNYRQASKTFLALVAKSKKTNFAERYSDEFKYLREFLLSRSPHYAAAVSIKNILSNDSSPVETFNNASTALSRYTKALNNLPSVSRLTEVRKAALQKLISDSKITSVKSNRIPFYYWAKEKQGAAHAYYNIVNRTKILKSNPEIKKLMLLATYLDDGNWPKVKAMYYLVNTEEIGNDKKYPEYIRKWYPAFIFAYGIADWQVGNGKHQKLIRQTLANMCRKYNKKPMSPLVTSLAFEYYTTTRQWEFPTTFSMQYTYPPSTTWPLGMRVGMLALLAAIEQADTKYATLNNLIVRIRKTYGTNKQLTGDFTYLRHSVQLFNGRPLNEKEINSLVASKCYFPDIAARVLLAALAKYHVQQTDEIKGEEKLIAALEKKITPLTASKSLWRKLNLYKMARTPYSTDIKKIAEKALSKLLISSECSYPEIIMIRCGAGALANGNSPSDTAKILSAFFNASSLTAKADVADLGILASPTPTTVIRELFHEHQTEKAFSYGILGIMMHCKEPLIKSRIVKELNSNLKSLNWEERFLIKQIQNWR